MLINSSRSVVENISWGEGGSPHSFSHVGEASNKRIGTGGAYIKDLSSLQITELKRSMGGLIKSALGTYTRRLEGLRYTIQKQLSPSLRVGVQRPAG